MSPSGYPVIRRRMREAHAPLAGEMSGHLFFADRFYGVDDAIYCAMRILSVVAAAGAPLADFRRGLPNVVSTPELRIPCAETRKRQVVTEIAERLRAENADLIDIDGVRVRREGGWWLLRASNTEPALAARCEGLDSEAFGRVKAELASLLAQSGVAVPEALAAPAQLAGGSERREQRDEALAGLLDRT
jgi:phosphomannomutase